MSPDNLKTELDYGISREEAISRVVNILEATYDCWQASRCNPDEFATLLEAAKLYIELLKYL